jgi:methylthioribulose-1-phosphate dehydratase
MLYTEDKDFKQRETASVFSEIASQLSRAGREFYSRGWVYGTSGNFSAVINEDPLRLAITSSGVDKSALSPCNILQIDAEGEPLLGEGKSSAETLLHLIVVKARRARAVLHTHSIWSTVLSELCAADRGITITGFEMLKGLHGVLTHEHQEWIPIIENTQKWEESRSHIEDVLSQHPAAHGFLIRGHGFYTWGRDVAEAKRHVEIFEFLFEVLGRKYSIARGEKFA